MGGMHTLNLSIPNLKQFASVSVFRSGWFGGRLEASEKKFAAALCDANAKKHLKLEWFSTGSQDFLLGATKDTIVLCWKATVAKWSTTKAVQTIPGRTDRTICISLHPGFSNHWSIGLT